MARSQPLSVPCHPSQTQIGGLRVCDRGLHGWAANPMSQGWDRISPMFNEVLRPPTLLSLNTQCRENPGYSEASWPANGAKRPHAKHMSGFLAVMHIVVAVWLWNLLCHTLFMLFPFQGFLEVCVWNCVWSWRYLAYMAFYLKSITHIDKNSTLTFGQLKSLSYYEHIKGL